MKSLQIILPGLLLAALVMLASCIPSAPAAESGVDCLEASLSEEDTVCVTLTVLVDLSETWHNDRDRQRNALLLQLLGEAIVETAERLQPLAVSYRIIGEDSLGRAPVCRAIYRQGGLTGAGGGGSSLTITRRTGEPRNGDNSLQSYLVNDCPFLLLSQGPERLTQISSALKTSAESLAQYDRNRVAMRIVILSDMKQETSTPPSLDGVNLEGVDVLILYRTLREDQEASDVRDRRLDLWEEMLTDAGARVERIDDSDVFGVSIARFLRTGSRVRGD